MKNSLTAELQRTQRADVLFYPAVRGNRIKGSLSASGRGLHKAIPSKRRRPSPWPDGILADYARLVELLMESGPNLRMPHSRAMGGGLFELRLRGREGIGRAFYCFLVGQRVVILHAFVKKTQETPERELHIARRRMKEVQNG